MVGNVEPSSNLWAQPFCRVCKLDGYVRLAWEAERSGDQSNNGLIVSPIRSTYGGYYGLVIVTPPRPQTLHRSHDNLKNPYRIASIFYM